MSIAIGILFLLAVLGLMVLGFTMTRPNTDFVLPADPTLNRMAVCVECDTLYPLRRGSCPSCTSKHFIPAGRILLADFTGRKTRV